MKVPDRHITHLISIVCLLTYSVRHLVAQPLYVEHIPARFECVVVSGEKAVAIAENPDSARMPRISLHKVPGHEKFNNHITSATT